MDEPQEPEVPLDPEPEVPLVTEPQVPPKRTTEKTTAEEEVHARGSDSRAHQVYPASQAAHESDVPENAPGADPSPSANVLRTITRMRVRRRRVAPDAPARDKPSALAVSQAQMTDAYAEMAATSDAPSDFAGRVEDIAIRLLGRDLLRGEELQLIAQLLGDGVPHATILRGIQESFDAFKPRYRGDRIKSLTYCEGRIRELHEMYTRPAPAVKGGYGPGKSRFRRAGRTIGDRQDEQAESPRAGIGASAAYSTMQPGKYNAFWDQFGTRVMRPEGGGDIP